jgi:hypothetical protein
MKTFVYAALALTLALATVAFAADLPDFTGNWKIDPSKMDDSKGPAPRMIRKVEKEGNVITVTEVQMRDGKGNAIVRRFSTDGSIVSSMMNGQRVKSHGKWDGNTLVSDTTVGENITIHDVWSLSDDGQIWTNDMVFNGHPNKLIFVRQYLPAVP